MSIQPTMKDIARRGLECDQRIEEMLSDIWREFEAIEPALAIKLVESLGPSKFAALTIIGRLNNQPSILEELSTILVSKEDINNLIELTPTFVAQLKVRIAASVRGDTIDYEFDDQASLFEQASRARKQYEQELVAIFRKLKEDDCEVANAVLELWEDENNAANYLASPVPALAGKSPLEVLDDGGRKEVLDLIFRLRHGVFS